jgi:hypothetical protein
MALLLGHPTQPAIPTKRQQENKHRSQNTNCKTQTAKHKLQNTNCKTQTAKHKLQNTNCKTQTAKHKLQNADNSLIRTVHHETALSCSTHEMSA